MPLLALIASTRPGSVNARLGGALIDRLEAAGRVVERVDYSAIEDLPIYTAQREAEGGLPPAAQALAAAIGAAQGVLIVSPEYNFSIPGGLKNALDWISRPRPYVLSGKPVLLAAASGSPVGGWRGLAALRQPLTCFGALLAPLDITLGAVTDAAAVDERLAAAVTSDRVSAALEAFGHLCHAAGPQERT